MSIAVFWSPLHGQGQTSNLHVTASIMGLLHKKKVLMMQTHFEKNNMESPLVGRNCGLQRGDLELFKDIGLDVAVTYSNMNKLSMKVLESCCLTFQDTSLMLLPGTDIRNRETFNRDIGRSVIRLIKKADALVDIILIDANSGGDELSYKLMAMADLIIVNLTQRRHVLESYFSDDTGYFSNKKVFYLFGDYDDNSIYNVNNCRARFNKSIYKHNSGVIPYCTKYMDAQSESDILSFMRNGLRIRQANDINHIGSLIKSTIRSGRYTHEDTEYFFSCSLMAVEKMLALIYASIRKDNREGSIHEYQ